MPDSRLRDIDIEIICAALESISASLPEGIEFSQNIFEGSEKEREKIAEIRTRFLDPTDEPFFLSDEEFRLVISSLKSLIDDYRQELRQGAKPKRIKTLHKNIRSANVCLSRLADAQYVSSEPFEHS